MFDFILNLAYLVVSLYVGVCIGVYLKLKEYGVCRSRFTLALSLFPFLLKRNILYVFDKMGGPEYKKRSIYKRVEIFVLLSVVYFKFMPLLIGVVANALAKKEFEMKDNKVVDIRVVDHSTDFFYDKIYKKTRIRYA